MGKFLEAPDKQAAIDVEFFKTLQSYANKKGNVQYSCIEPRDHFSSYDVIQRITDENGNTTEQLIELKARNIPHDKFKDLTIDINKIDNLQKLAEEKGVDAYLIGFYKPDRKICVWKIKPLGENYDTVIKMCPKTQFIGNNQIIPKVQARLLREEATIYDIPQELDFDYVIPAPKTAKAR